MRVARDAPTSTGPDIQHSLRAQVGLKEMKGIFGVKETADHRLGSQETLEGFVSEGKKREKINSMWVKSL